MNGTWCSTKIAKSILFFTPFKKTLGELSYYSEFFDVDCRLHDNIIDAIDAGRIYKNQSKRYAFRQAHRMFRESMQKHIIEQVHPAEQWEHEQWADRFYTSVSRYYWIHRFLNRRK